MSKAAGEVEAYTDLDEHFHVDQLRRQDVVYGNYQIIRNLLASIQHERRHVLICDERRPDLVREYLETVVCLREVTVRKRCRVVFWQELARVCGKDLAEFLRERYGIS